MDIANFLPTSAEYFRVLPEIILTLVGVLIMFLEAVTKEDQKGIFAPLSIAGLVAALVGAVVAYGDPGPAFQNMLIDRRFRYVLPGAGDRRRSAGGASARPVICAAKIRVAASSTR